MPADSNRSSRSPRLLGPAAALVPLCFATFAACRRAEPVVARPAEPQAIEVRVAGVETRALPRHVDVVGTLFGVEETTISAKVAGRVVAIAHDLGDAVAPGEVLARIDAVDYELAVAEKEAWLRADLAPLGLTKLPDGELDVAAVPSVARARLELQNAETRLGRAAAMFAEQPPLITEQEHTDQQNARDVAKSALDTATSDAQARFAQALVRTREIAVARQKLDDATVKAPAAPGADSWSVARRAVAVGEQVQVGTAMFALVDPDPILFRADVPERFSAAVQIGQAATLRVAGAPQEWSGVVQRKAPRIDAQKRTFQVEIRVTNADRRLLPGGFAQGGILVRTDPKVAFVPQDAVVTALGTNKVFTVKDGKAVEHQVRTGMPAGAMIEIDSDLGGATEVVTTGAARLANGMTVTVARGGDAK